MLKLADEQARVRAMIEKEQEDVQGLNERNYRKFVRNCIRQRIEFIKQVRLVVMSFLAVALALPVEHWTSHQEELQPQHSSCVQATTANPT